jgi:plasmid stabilization system protein ParE
VKPFLLKWFWRISELELVRSVRGFRHRDLADVCCSAQLRQAQDWWNLNRPEAPGWIEEEFRRALATLQECPRAGNVDSGFVRGIIRRLYLRRVRYFLYYRFDGQRLEIVAFWHTSRGNRPPIDA